MVTTDELIACSISSWLPHFERNTFPTILIPLPDDFIEWLLEDGVMLPESSIAVSQFLEVPA